MGKSPKKDSKKRNTPKNDSKKKKYNYSRLNGMFIPLEINEKLKRIYIYTIKTKIPYLGDYPDDYPDEFKFEK
jgi:hypothetical protein